MIAGLRVAKEWIVRLVTDDRMPPQEARVVAARPTRRKTTNSAIKMLVRGAIDRSAPTSCPHLLTPVTHSGLRSLETPALFCDVTDILKPAPLTEVAAPIVHDLTWIEYPGVDLAGRVLA